MNHYSECEFFLKKLNKEKLEEKVPVFLFFKFKKKLFEGNYVTIDPLLFHPPSVSGTCLFWPS